MFINAWAGLYKNRWYWDNFLNRLEGTWVPERLSRWLRQSRVDDYLHERVHRIAAKYDRILGKGNIAVTTTISEFRQDLAKSIRKNPGNTKVICSGDGGIREAFTTGINYVDNHNALEEKVAAIFNQSVLEKIGGLNERLQDFLTELPLRDALSRSSLSPLARAVLREKKVDFNFLPMELTREEKQFLAEYNLTLSDLLTGQLDYPSFGITPGGTFNVAAHNFGIGNDTKYLRSLNELRFTHYRPLQVEFTDNTEKKRRFYGNIFGIGAIRGFFERYYGGTIRPSALKAAYLSLLYKYVNRKDYDKITEARPYSLEVNGDKFDYDATLALATGIKRLPFKMEFFRPEEEKMHLTVTKRPAKEIVKKGLLAIPYIGKPLKLLRVKDRYDIEHDYTDVEEVILRSGNTQFIFDGDIQDENGIPYDSPEVKLSMGPELRIAVPGDF